MKLIGRYEIQNELGRGGFGQVFRAFDPVVGRLVALKTLLAADDPELLKRFRNEAGATGKLRHDNVVVIYDFGEHEGAPYLVMELMEGQDLEQVIAGGNPMNLLEKVDAISQMAAGLHHAHSQGIVHRDVKPANMMLISGNRIKIMDFGIALLSQVTAARITPQGSILGTLPYMSPEQFQGAESDCLTDIFALGVTCYKFLTGVHPFQAPELAGLMGNIINKAPESLRRLMPDCPEALEHVISRLLAKEREERYQSLEDAIFDLEPISVELRRDRLGELVRRARTLIASDRLEEAQTTVREALDLEPVFLPARELREHLHHLIKERSIRPKVAALIATGRHYLEIQVYDEAIEKFESALKLDRSNEDIRFLINESRAAWERRLRADRLLKDARHAFNQGNLTVAQQIIIDAIAAFPEHAAAVELQTQVSVEIEARHREEKLREALNRASSLMRIESFDAAIEVLQDLETSFADSPEVRRHLQDALAHREGRVRKEQLRHGTDQVRRLLKEQRIEDASSLVASLQVNFPESTELATLASYLAEEQKVRSEAAAIAAKSSEARDLISRNLLIEAIGLLRATLAEHPGASILRELLQGAESAKAEKDRSSALAQVVADANSLLSRQSFAQALDRIASFTTGFGNAAALDPLRTRAEEGLEKLRRVAAVRKLVLEAQGLIDEGRPGTASNVLQKATVLYPGESEISRLLRVADHQVRAQQIGKEISGIVAEGERLARGRLFKEALELLDRALKDYPAETRLTRCREAIAAGQKAFALEAHIAGILAAASRLSSESEFQSALDLLDSASLSEMGSDERFPKLRKEIRAQLLEAERQEEIRQTLQEAERLIEIGDPLAATRMLGGIQGGKSDAEVARLTALAQERSQQRALADEISGIVANARALREAGRFEAAEMVCYSGLAMCSESAEIQKEYQLARAERIHFEEVNSTFQDASSLGGSGQFARALNTLDTAPERIRREPSIIALRSSLQINNEVAMVVLQADTLRAVGNHSGALKLLTEGLVRYPHNPELTTELQRVENDLLEAQKEVAIESLLEQARTFIDGNPERALKLTKEGLERFGFSNRLNDFARRAEVEVAKRKLDRDIGEIRIKAEAFLRGGDFEQAIASIEQAGFASVALADLLSSARKLQGRSVHDDLLAEAHQLCAQSRFEEAMSAVQRAIVRHGGSPESNDLRTRLQTELEQRKLGKVRDTSLKRLRILDQALSTGLPRFFLARSSSVEARELRSGYDSDPEFIFLESRINEKGKIALALLRKIRNRAFQAVVAVCIVAGVAIPIRDHLRRTETPIHIEVRTDPKGASIVFGDHSCVTPNCVFAILPGHYNVQAHLRGFQSVQRELDAAKGSDGYVMDLVLQAESVQLSAASGTGAGPRQTGEPAPWGSIGSTPQKRNPTKEPVVYNGVSSGKREATPTVPAGDSQIGGLPIQTRRSFPTQSGTSAINPSPAVNQQPTTNAILASSTQAQTSVTADDEKKPHTKDPPTVTVPRPEPAKTNRGYYGPVQGEIIWRGTLPAGGRVLLTGSGSDSGSVVSGSVPAGVEFVNVTAKSNGSPIRAEALLNSRISVFNSTDHPLDNVIVTWKTK